MSFDGDTEIPLPGHVLRPGIPAPANARLSLGLGLGAPSTPTRQNQPTTTIRLISNLFPNTNTGYGAGENGTPQLQPFKTSFDLILGSPTPDGVSGSMSTWPPSPEDDYPAFEAENVVNGLGPRRPSVSARRASSTRVISNGRRSKVAIPGAFGFEEEEDEDKGSEKWTWMEQEVQEQEQKNSQQKIRLERENEAIRKKLEANRARRRSSAVHGGFHGRKSGRISAGRVSLLGKPKPKPSRFGFLSSAKSLVQNVWNRGNAPAPVVTSNIPKPTVVNANASSKPASASISKAKLGPLFGPTKKSSIAPAHSTTAVAIGSRIPSVRNPSYKSNTKAAEESKPVLPSGSATGKGTSTSTSSSGSRLRSPLPPCGSTRNSLQSNAGTRTSRKSSVVGRNSGHTAGVSSIGSRVSSTRMSSTGGVSSMGSKKTVGGASVSSRSSATGSFSRFSSITSRLFAPTASSLAKANGRPSTGAGELKAASEDRQHPPLGAITNGAALHSAEASSPNSSKIFTKPLLLPQHSGIPTPVKNRRVASSDSTTLARANSIQKSLTGRKPRISRSKVIARLASQRAARGNENENGPSGNRGAGLTPRSSKDPSGRTRSSLGAQASRASYGGGTRARASGGGGVTMSAKKRARQSEYARRKSKVVTPLVLDRRSAGAIPSGMDLDSQ